MSGYMVVVTVHDKAGNLVTEMSQSVYGDMEAANEMLLSLLDDICDKYNPDLYVITDDVYKVDY